MSEIGNIGRLVASQIPSQHPSNFMPPADRSVEHDLGQQARVPGGVFGHSNLFSHVGLGDRAINHNNSSEVDPIKISEFRDKLSPAGARGLHGLENELRGPLSDERVEWLMSGLTRANIPDTYREQSLRQLNEYHSAG